MTPSALELTTFSFPTRIRYGVGALSALQEFAEMHNARRPLLVTDRGLPGTAAYELTVAEMNRVWPGAWAQYAGVHPNPIEQDVDEAWQQYQASSCDSIVGVGG